MKNHSPLRVVSPIAYFLSTLCLLFCSLLPLRAVLPSGWTGANIGAATGSESFSGTGGGPNPFVPTDTFTVMGNGAGVLTGYSVSDNDHFTYTTLPGGDMEIVARLVNFTCTKDSSAGLMIRQALTTSDPNKAATWYMANYANSGTNYLVTKGWGPALAGDAAYYYGQARGKAVPIQPYWLKLVRVGKNFGAYWSLDGITWNLQTGEGGGALFGTGAFNIGFFVSNPDGTLATATFDNVYVGAPRLKYKTTWVGNTSGGKADGYVSNCINALWVKDDGTCYANSTWDEAGQAVKAYKDGKVAFALPGALGSGLYEGTVTGNANNLFLAKQTTAPNPVASPTPILVEDTVYRTDFNGQNATPVVFNSRLGDVGGMAASSDWLFVSDITNHNVRIVDLKNYNPPKEVGLVAATVSHPGPIAFDGTNFWIIDCGSDFPLTAHVSPTYPAAVRCYSPAGLDLGRTIIGVSNPTALAKHPTLDRLYICDNGPNQNISYYSGLTTATPTCAGSFGLAGGLWNAADSAPGQIYEPQLGMGGHQRFYGPTGVGFDGSGNIYVACNGNGSGTDLRRFDTSGALVWRQLGLEFIDVGDFDPATDGAEIFTTQERFQLNYANAAPGSEWDYTAFTKNPFQANDVRNNVGGITAHGTVLRRLAGNNLFMYTAGMGSAEPIVFYRFNSARTTAIPYGRIYPAVGGTGVKLWIDANGDGLEPSPTDPPEYTQVINPLAGSSSYDIDSEGNFWGVQGQSYDSPYRSSIMKIPCTGTQLIGPSGGIPVPAYNLAGSQFFLAPLKALTNIKYDKANDVMYCMGQQDDGKWVVARYDNWLASPTPDDHRARYVVSLPDKITDVTTLAYPGTNPNYNLYRGLGLAGDKVFVGDMWGPIYVYDANTGNPVITLNPGPEVSANMGWQDMLMGMNVFKRSTGEYLVTVEDAGFNARNLLYRWTPTADTTVPGAITNLTAIRQGHAIALSWTGPAGTVASYNIYRGTSSGSLTLYQSNVNVSYFVDTNVTPGTTYYYTVAAVSTVGTGAQSNQVSAMPASGQAEFVKYDATTQGTWWPATGKVYGVDGQFIAGQAPNNPSYGSSPTTVTPDHPTVYNRFTDPTTDPRALQIPPTGATRTGAFFAAWLASPPQTQQSFNLNFSDIKWHQVSMYMVFWDGYNPDVKVEVLDGNGSSNIVLDTRYPMDFAQGKWLVWNVRGNVTIRLTNGWSCSEVGGIFFDPVQTPVSPTKAWWKLDETSGTIAADSSGAGNNATKVAGSWSTPGQINGCMAFGGTSSNSNLTLPDLIFWVPQMTLSLWFQTNTSGVLVGVQNQAAGPPPTDYCPIMYVGTDNKLHGAFYTGAIRTMTSAATVTSSSAWHHAALTSDGLIQTLYLDGEVAGMQVAPVGVLGHSWCGQGYTAGYPNISTGTLYLNGKMDDLRLYNRVLSNSEIGKLANP